MGDIVKLALRLFIFAFVASVLLAMTNEVTKDPIEAQKLASKMAALKTVLPGCEYEQIEYEGLADDSVLDEIFAGKDADGNVKGYALTHKLYLNSEKNIDQCFPKTTLLF